MSIAAPRTIHEVRTAQVAARTVPYAPEKQAVADAAYYFGCFLNNQMSTDEATELYDNHGPAYQAVWDSLAARYLSL
ncbi:Uncharacterised protein [Mycobacteroides abscessus subsp. abscessus]|uniref:hypothetical protein n=1 Tax=Mycobacteroides abscessus TaxID=36809 RepID=UPI000925EF49|nr:hypothetical protein [Mycobacteroides abscessus]SHU27260.1 Uncharacterised protein [Mycobacteroides abscessus subsp. abscessus]